MIPEKKYRDQLVRELVALELPSLLNRHNKRMEHNMPEMTDQELLDELARPNTEAIKLLTEAAGTVEASTVEDNISDDRKVYRKDLLVRIRAFLKSLA